MQFLASFSNTYRQRWLFVALLLFLSLGQSVLFAQSATDLTNRSTIKRIRDRGNVLVVGILYDYPPFSFFNEQGEIAGFDIDLLQAVAEEWGVNVQFVPVTASTRLQNLAAGQIDLIASGFPHTVSAELAIDFSQTYFEDDLALLTSADLSVDDLGDWDGLAVAAIEGDTAMTQLRAAASKAGSSFSVLPFQEYLPALAALNARQVDALMAHRAYLAHALSTLPDTTIATINLGSEPYGFGLPEGDSDFRALVDATLQTLTANGVYAALYTRWFENAPPYLLQQLPGRWPYSFTDAPAASNTPQHSRIVDLQQRKRLLVGAPYDFAPFGFLTPQGEVIGFDIDLSHELARRWLGDATAVELVRITPDIAVPLLAAGQIDLVVAALPYSQERETQIDFSLIYFEDEQGILAAKTQSIEDFSDLSSKTVGILAGSSLQTEVAERMKQLGIKLEILPFQERLSAEQALLAGQVDALIGSSAAAARFIQAHPEFVQVAADFNVEPYAVGLPAFDAPLRDVINLTLQAMKADGTYDQLYAKWFGDAPPYALELWSGVGLDELETQRVGLSLEMIPFADTILAPRPINTPLSQTTSSLASTITATPRAIAVAATVTPTSTATRIPVTRQPTIAATSSPRTTPTTSPTARVFDLATAAPATRTPSAVNKRFVLIPTATPIATLTSRAAATGPSGPNQRATATKTAQATSTPEIVSLATGAAITPTQTLTTTPPTAPPIAAVTGVTVTPGVPIAVSPDFNVNARNAADTAAPIVTVIRAGSTLIAIARTEDNAWIQVRLPTGRTAWMLTVFITTSLELIQTLPTESPTATVGGDENPTPPANALAIHHVGPADTLTSLAERYYGDQDKWVLIYFANQAQIGADPNVIEVGTDLVIPKDE